MGEILKWIGGAVVVLFLLGYLLTDNETTTGENSTDVAIASGADGVAEPVDTDWRMSSVRAELTLVDSEWAHQSKVKYAECYGLGDFVREYSSPKYRRFRCVIQDADFAEFTERAYIEVTGPEEVTVTDLR